MPKNLNKTFEKDYFKNKNLKTFFQEEPNLFAALSQIPCSLFVLSSELAVTYQLYHSIIAKCISTSPSVAVTLANHIIYCQALLSGYFHYNVVCMSVSLRRSVLWHSGSVHGLKYVSS